MTNQEAIDLLDNLIGMIEDNHGSDYDSAIRMAIDALTEPDDIDPQPQWAPCSECEKRCRKWENSKTLQD